MPDSTIHSWNSSHYFTVRVLLFALGPGSSFQKPIEHFHMHVPLSAQTLISWVKPPSYLALLPISPPLFSIGGIPLSQSLRDTSMSHRSLFPLHYLSYLITHGILLTLPLQCPFLPSAMATALCWLIFVTSTSLFPSIYLPPGQTILHILARLI